MLSDQFYEDLFHKHQTTPHFPKTSTVARLVSRIILLLFPEQTKQSYSCVESLKSSFDSINKDLNELLSSMQEHLKRPSEDIANDFALKVPEIYELLLTDIQSIINGDPAANSEYEII